jgi:hypothetical protein
MSLTAATVLGQIDEEGEFSEKALKSDSEMQAELTRIQQLPTPAYELIPDAVRSAETAIKRYQDVQKRSLNLSDNDIERLTKAHNQP